MRDRRTARRSGGRRLLLTLYITPVYYLYIEGARLRLARRRAARESLSAAAPQPRTRPR